MTGSVQVIRKSGLKYALAATDSFIAEVMPGETFEVETELNIGGHLITDLADRLSASDVTLPVKSRLFVHPLDEQFRLLAAPLLQRLNGRLMLQSSLRDEVVVGGQVMVQCVVELRLQMRIWFG